MLLKGLNHVAVLTHDASRLNDFYREVFDAEILHDGSEFPEGNGPRLSIIKIGDWAELNVFEIEGNSEADRQTPMFGRGRLDHLALQAGSLPDFETIRERLMARGLADDFVTDFGPMLSLFFRDPDGLESEVCVENPDAVPGQFQSAGNPGAPLLLSSTGSARVDDIEAIKHLKARYFRTMDTKDWVGMRHVFTDDVVMDTTASGGGVITGADAFVAFLRETLADAVTVHHGHMPEIMLSSSGTATGIWALHDEIVWPDGTRMVGDGHYHETYVQVDGLVVKEWRIASSTLTRLRMDVSGPER